MKEPELPVGNIFKNRFSDGKGYIEEKLKNMTGSGLGLKGSVSSKSLSLRVNVERKRIFSPKTKKNNKQENNGVFNIGSGYLPQAQHRNIYGK